jgi:hypothetical protein
MAILSRKITTYTQNVKDLADTPALTATQLKAFFDGRGDNELKTSINGIVDDLSATTDGASGADQIGATPVKDGGAETVQGILEEIKTDAGTDLATHMNDVANPHEVTKSQVGLGNADNTADVNKAVLSATKLATARKIGDADFDGSANISASDIGIYTKTEMQGDGTALLHWNNLTNKPNFADPSWKPSVATTADLPIVGNTVGDQRVILNDGDSKQAMYLCIATTGTYLEQWKKIGDVDWTNNHANLVGLNGDDHTQYHNDARGDLRYYTKTAADLLLGGKSDTTHNHEGTYVTETDGQFDNNVDFQKNQALNMAAHNKSTAPDSPSLGQWWYDTIANRLKVYKGAVAGWTDLSSRGGVMREVEFTATASQTVFTTTSVGTYTVGDNSMSVYKKNAFGMYEKLDTSDYTETDNETITLDYGCREGDEILLRWLEATADLLSLTVLKDGTLQVNLDADMLDGQHGSYYAKASDVTALEVISDNIDFIAVRSGRWI